MGVPATPAAPPSSAPIALEHWVYGSVPEVGYSIRAQSANVNLSFYARRLEGIYTPISGESLHGEDVVVDVAMLHPTGSGNEVLFSIISPGPPDEEYKRRTFVNHTAVVPIAALRSGSLAFDDVERAIRAYDRTRAAATGTIDPLPVVPSEGPGARSPPATGIERYVTRAAAETLLTRSLLDPESRTLVLCRDTPSDVRRLTLLRLLELLGLVCRMPFVSCLSDAPGGPVANRFQLVVSARAFRTDPSWALLENGLEAPTLPRVKDQDAAYAALGACFP